jgi:hypothetical protein
MVLAIAWAPFFVKELKGMVLEERGVVGSLKSNAVALFSLCSESHILTSMPRYSNQK